MNCINNQKEITIGVDTGKFQLDIYVRSLDIYFNVTNNEKGIKEAIKKIKYYKPTRIVIEATGRLEHAFIMACSQANLPFTVANPAHVKNLQGQLDVKQKQTNLMHS